MRYVSLFALLVAMVTAGCSFQNSSERLIPTGPNAPTGGNGGSTGSTGGSGGSGGNSGGNSAATTAAFEGAWGSSTIAGLPVANCADLKWLITAQTDTSVSGTITANCANGVSVAANLTGTLQSANVIGLVATGTLTANGLPCQFTLNGTGTRQSDNSMKVDYNGSFCLGTVSGSETLRKFPDV